MIKELFACKDYLGLPISKNTKIHYFESFEEIAVPRNEASGEIK